MLFRWVNTSHNHRCRSDRPVFNLPGKYFEAVKWSWMLIPTFSGKSTPRPPPPIPELSLGYLADEAQVSLDVSAEKGINKNLFWAIALPPNKFSLSVTRVHDFFDPVGWVELKFLWVPVVIEEGPLS